jgi:hypothetical protein
MARPPPGAADVIILHGGVESVSQAFLELFLSTAAIVLLVLGTTGTFVYLRRRWRRRPPGFLRVHLSTFIIVMFTAAVLVGLNVVPRVVMTETLDSRLIALASAETGSRLYPYEWHQCGWPVACYFSYPEGWSWSHTRWEMLALNITVALALLAAAAVACEWRIRRRRPASPTGNTSEQPV